MFFATFSVASFAFLFLPHLGRVLFQSFFFPKKKEGLPFVPRSSWTLPSLHFLEGRHSSTIPHQTSPKIQETIFIIPFPNSKRLFFASFFSPEKKEGFPPFLRFPPFALQSGLRQHNPHLRRRFLKHIERLNDLFGLMFGNHAKAQTGSVLWHGGVHSRRHENAAL